MLTHHFPDSGLQPEGSADLNDMNNGVDQEIIQDDQPGIFEFCADESDEFDEFDAEGDEELPDDDVTLDTAYTRVAQEMPQEGARTIVEQFIHDCSVSGRQGPPLTSRASPLSAAAADRNQVPVICVDHGKYMIPPIRKFVKDVMGSEYLAEAFERMGGVYALGIKYSQWKQGLQLGIGVGLSCPNISKSNGKYSEAHHEDCLEEPCLCQINSTGVVIMQCNSHRQVPKSFNHLSLGSYWYNFSSELVCSVGSFFTCRAKWRAVIRPRLVLLDWMLLAYIYLEQDINMKQGKPTRFPYVAIGNTAPKLSAAKPEAAAAAALAIKAASAKKANPRSSGKKSGIKVIGGSSPKPRPNGRGKGGSSANRGKPPASSQSAGSANKRKEHPTDSDAQPSLAEIRAMPNSSAKKALLKFMDAVVDK